MTYKEMKSQLLNSPATRRWVVKAIQELERKDPADVLLDLQTLVELFQLRCVELEL